MSTLSFIWHFSTSEIHAHVTSKVKPGLASYDVVDPDFTRLISVSCTVTNQQLVGCRIQLLQSDNMVTLVDSCNRPVLVSLRSWAFINLQLNAKKAIFLFDGNWWFRRGKQLKFTCFFKKSWVNIEFLLIFYVKFDQNRKKFAILASAVWAKIAKKSLFWVRYFSIQV